MNYSIDDINALFPDSDLYNKISINGGTAIQFLFPTVCNNKTMAVILSCYMNNDAFEKSSNRLKNYIKMMEKGLEYFGQRYEIKFKFQLFDDGNYYIKQSVWQNNRQYDVKYNMTANHQIIKTIVTSNLIINEYKPDIQLDWGDHYTETHTMAIPFNNNKTSGYAITTRVTGDNDKDLAPLFDKVNNVIKILKDVKFS